MLYLEQAEAKIKHIAGWWKSLSAAVPEDYIPTQAETDVQTLLELSRSLLSIAQEVRRLREELADTKRTLTEACNALSQTDFPVV